MNDQVKNIENKINIDLIRSQFPILDQRVNGHPLIYFDNAATTQKPLRVIKSLENYYKGYNSNIHRGLHTLAEKATEEFEKTRIKAAEFIHANETEEIIFTKGTTEGINLIAQTYGRKNLKVGDEVVISTMEHHSNIVPWQLICEEKNAKLKVIPVDENGDLLYEEFRKLISPRTKIVAVVYASNSLGTVNPVKEIIKTAHEAGAIVVLDGAQAAPHLPLDVVDIDCDFLAFSAHKMYGPTGVGVLYGKRKHLEAMPPFQGGGEMISDVTFEKTTYNDIPYKFEAGTPNIADVIAFGEAIEFIRSISRKSIVQYENELISLAHNLAGDIDGIRILGMAKNKVSVFSFLIDGVHPLDLGLMLDTKGIAVRTGHHCTQPLMDRFNIDGTVRASFAVYNTKEEIEALFVALKEITEKLRK